MVKEFTVKNSEELYKILEHGDYKISKAIVDKILENLNGTKKHVHVVSIFCEEDSYIYDLTLERKNFSSTLESNLETFEQAEDYEGCAQIKKAIEQLKK
jgi:arginine repressor